VVFLLLVAVNKILRESDVKVPDLMQWLDIVALGTICDVVPLTGANRALVAQGLKIMRQRQNTGINAAMDVARLAEAPDTYHAGFVIGPRINAGGRVGNPDLGVRLLTATDAIEAKKIAEALNQFNDERKAIESLVLEEAMQKAAALPSDSPFILVAQEGWHPGVIGVVAGRIKETFHKPTAIVALKDGMGKASARSVTGVDLGNAVVSAVHAGLLVGGGGHAMAAGFTVEEEKLPALQAFISSRVMNEFLKLPRERVLWIDASVAQPGITLELARQLEKLGPFGASHPQVRLRINRVRAVNTSIVGASHVRTILVDATTGSTSTGLKAMAFRSAETPLGQILLHNRGKILSVAGTMRINSWQGRESVDFFIEDALTEN
jgi:single-stranded-DNA-specific exonuclease